MSHLPCLIPTLYLPPISSLIVISTFNEIMVNDSERYCKQSYRNRATILGANGVQTLTVPIVNGHSLGIPIKEAKIAYDTRWQQMHWRSIVSAYKSSPFFEYYEDDFAPFYHKQYDFLYDFNLEIFNVILNLIDFTVPKSINSINKQDVLPIDLQHLASSKGEIKIAFQEPYWQVFQERHGFVSNLSVLDLLFNLGSESYLYLEEMAKKQNHTSLIL